MTTKSEETASAAEPNVAAPPAGGADAGLPSIIVDPKALAPSEPPVSPSPPPEAEAPVEPPTVPAEPAAAETLAGNPAPAPEPIAGLAEAAVADAAGASAEQTSKASTAQGDAPPPPAPAPASSAKEEDVASTAEARGNGAASLELSDLDAERFASSYRASWEPGEPLDAPLPVVAQPVAADPGDADAATHEPEAAAEPPIVLPGSGRSRGLAMTAIAVLAFGALLALALSSTQHEGAPDDQTPSTQAAPSPAPIEAPAPEPVAPPPPEAPLPTAAAADPSAAGAAAALAGSEAVPPVDPAAIAAPEGAAAGAPAEAEPTAPAEAPVAAAVPEPPPPPPPPRIETVRIQIATSPGDATLSIDGVPVANPYDELVEKSGKHRITATAPGHEPIDQLVGFERKRDLMLRLKAVRAPRPAPAAAPTPVARPARPTPAKPAKTAKKPATSSEPRKGAAFISESPY